MLNSCNQNGKTILSTNIYLLYPLAHSKESINDHAV